MLGFAFRTVDLLPTLKLASIEVLAMHHQVDAALAARKIEEDKEVFYGSGF